jgi:hypothetical protein
MAMKMKKFYFAAPFLRTKPLTRRSCRCTWATSLRFSRATQTSRGGRGCSTAERVCVSSLFNSIVVLFLLFVHSFFPFILMPLRFSYLEHFKHAMQKLSAGWFPASYVELCEPELEDSDGEEDAEPQSECVPVILTLLVTLAPCHSHIACNSCSFFRDAAARLQKAKLVIKEIVDTERV